MKDITNRSLSLFITLLLSLTTLVSTGAVYAAGVTKTNIKSLTYNKSGKKIVVKWKKLKKVNGYQIQYAAKKNFKGKKVVTIKKKSATKATVKNIKSKKTYYFRIRAFKKNGKNTQYGKFSKVKSIKTVATPVALPTTITTCNYNNKEGQNVYLKWKKSAGATGYEIQYATLKDFEYYQEIMIYKNENDYTIKKLSLHKTFYFRVRSFADTPTGRVFSKFSPVVTVTTSPYYTTPQALNDKAVGKSTMVSKITGKTYTLKFLDDFKGTTLDTKNWTIDEICANGSEKQQNLKENVEVANDNLILHAKLDTVEHYQYVSGNSAPVGKTKYTGAKINSQHKKYFKYGRIEMYSKLPQGQGAWPAFWTMGEGRGWPWGGEIDILEMANGVDYRYHSTIHWCDPNDEPSFAYGDGHLSLSQGFTAELIDEEDKLADAYHVIGLEWTPTNLHFYFDGEEFGRTPITQKNMEYAFHNDHFMIINYALGGMGGKIDDHILPQKMYVDWVKVWQTN